MQLQTLDMNHTTEIPRINLNFGTLAPSKSLGDTDRSYAQERYCCPCDQCRSSMHSIKKRKKIFPYESNPFARVFCSSPKHATMTEEKDFAFVLKRLMPPPNVDRSIRIMIPETAVFIGSELKTIAYTDKVFIESKHTQLNLYDKSLRIEH